VIGQTILFLTILFLPTQLGKHFWPDFAYVGGFRLDYLSPTLYLTDLLIFCHLAINHQILKKILHPHRPTLVLLGFIFLNLLFSLNPLAGLFLWLRWVIYLLFSLTLLRQKLSDILFPLSLSVLVVVGLAAIQIILQHSLGGVFYYLGERDFGLLTPMVAKVNFFGRLFLRPYATFSHPNSLAGFLLLALILLRHSRNKFPPFLSALGVILSLSKTGIITLVLYLSGLFKTGTLLLIIFLPLLILIYAPVTPSLSARLPQLQPALHSIRQYPIFGVGLGGFYSSLLSELPQYQITPANLQPVHNLPLLMLSEIGLVGVALIVIVFLRLRLLSHPLLLQATSIILLTGGFDHYWWTLPQNKLILLITLVLLYKIDTSDKKTFPNRNSY